MRARASRWTAVLAAAVAVATMATLARTPRAAPGFPDAARDESVSPGRTVETAVLAGGCFWGVEAVFERLKGVADVVSGYAGGSASTAHYDVVSMGGTGHAESVRITYDPSQITFGRLLKVFFAVAHDPTQMNRQGPDEGTQYRSSIFYATGEQQEVAAAYIRQLEAAHVFRRPIVTAVVPLQGFYPAEPYHQHFLDRHRSYPYIVINDLPKLASLQHDYPELLKTSSR